MSTVKAWAALAPGNKLQPFTYELGELLSEEVEIEVLYCGVCHTDIAFINDQSGMVPFPLVPGHEITGRVTALGEVAASKGLSIGQIVGVGWNKESCGHCQHCLDGDQHLCDTVKATIWGNYGGFANRVKAHWIWVIPVPAGIDPRDAGPLFCAGITVFSPLVLMDIKPTSNVGVFGIGGLGHLAIQFSRAWGADVTAFSSSATKTESIRELGASHIVSSRDTSEWENLKGKFDLIIITVSVTLDWDKIIQMLSPKGRLHFVGIVYEPVPVNVLSLLTGQKAISSSPTGSRGTIDKMLGFAARHSISVKAEHFPMSKVNEAIEYAESGKANYRVVLDADFA
jgi:uncharacterized zinc-type alcohol dehydrogenase-like protein